MSVRERNLNDDGSAMTGHYSHVGNVLSNLNKETA